MPKSTQTSDPSVSLPRVPVPGRPSGWFRAGSTGRWTGTHHETAKKRVGPAHTNSPPLPICMRRLAIRLCYTKTGFSPRAADQGPHSAGLLLYADKGNALLVAVEGCCWHIHRSAARPRPHLERNPHIALVWAKNNLTAYITGMRMRAKEASSRRLPFRFLLGLTGVGCRKARARSARDGRQACHCGN
jgi:hypothetical protein